MEEQLEQARQKIRTLKAQRAPKNDVKNAILDWQRLQLTNNNEMKINTSGFVLSLKMGNEDIFNYNHLTDKGVMLNDQFYIILEATCEKLTISKRIESKFNIQKSNLFYAIIKHIQDHTHQYLELETLLRSKHDDKNDFNDVFLFFTSFKHTVHTQINNEHKNNLTEHIKQLLILQNLCNLMKELQQCEENLKNETCELIANTKILVNGFELIWVPMK